MTKTKWEAGWLISQAFCQLLPWKPRVCCCLFYACCVCVMVYVCASTPVEARGQSWSGFVSQELTKNASLAAQEAPRISLHLALPTALGLQACPEISIFTWVPKLARHAFFQRSHFSSPKTKLLRIQMCVLQSPESPQCSLNYPERPHLLCLRSSCFLQSLLSALAGLPGLFSNSLILFLTFKSAIHYFHHIFNMTLIKSNVLII